MSRGNCTLLSYALPRSLSHGAPPFQSVLLLEKNRLSSDNPLYLSKEKKCMRSFCFLRRTLTEAQFEVFSLFPPLDGEASVPPPRIKAAASLD